MTAEGGDSTNRDVRRARSGEEEGFARLYERLAPAVHAWARLRIPAAARATIDPDDIVQEVWWRVLDAFGRRKEATGAFRPWVFGIASKVLLEAFRKGRSRAPVGEGALPERLRDLPEDVAAEVTSIVSSAANAEDALHVAELIGDLDEPDRTIVIRCGLEGALPTAVAEQAQLTPDACVKRWQRLRERLRDSPAWRALAGDGE